MELESIARMTKDIASAAKTLSDDEARFLVDAYYIMQEDRKRTVNQVRTLDESKEPNLVLRWLAAQAETLELQIKRALDKYTDGHPMGTWMRSIHGIGPVISAGLLAHISMTPWQCAHTRKPNERHSNPFYDATEKKSCTSREPHGSECHTIELATAGQLWRYAGLDPTSKWNKGEKRPFNSELKVLCWKVGQSFMKFHKDEKCYYGHIYVERKAYENARNDRGENQAEAVRILKERNFGKTTDAYRHYNEGNLPPAQIDARARRYAVKIFLSHLHSVWYNQHFGRPAPLPFAIAQLGRAQYISPPMQPL